MKTIDEILRRAIILVCFADRCALEDEIIEGRSYSIEERREQKNLIHKWLKNEGYMQDATEHEKALFEIEIGTVERKSILEDEVQYEAVQPCLWAVSLVSTLANYNDWVLDDFHPVLKIGQKDVLTSLKTKSELREIESIRKQTEIAMLWHWRTIEVWNPDFKERDAREIVLSTFSFNKEYKKYVKYISFSKKTPKDFCVGSKPFYSLSKVEQGKISAIAYWRHHAFEWIIGDDEWDEVDTTT